MTVENFPEGLTQVRDGGLCTVIIDRLADMNRLSPDVLTRLGAIADALRDDTDINVLVMTGAGAEIFSMAFSIRRSARATRRTRS